MSSAESYTLITGASSGIGRQTALQLAASRRLILHGRDTARLAATREACPSPEKHLIWPFDLRQVEQLEKSLTELLCGGDIPIASFVHCAGAVQVVPLRQLELIVARELMNVNFHAAVEISRLLVSRRINQKHLRRLVFVSSTASQFGARGFQMYCATKAALDGFMRAIAVELAPQVRVNSVLPGAVETPMTDQLLGDSAVRERMAAVYPLGLGQPADIAGVIEFLLSDNANWITGQQIVVDGGRSINHSA
ncbi:MAG TPA: SDR family oxidoreductase [Planctomycetaceae bacterium]|jgi:NAD(P)-dependent dehydrogenase (short-subunit alcohol dehydrogenase family)